MSILLLREIESLKKKVLFMSSQVIKILHAAIQSVENRNHEQARLIEGEEKKIDTLEIDLEEDCLKVLALHQPVAIDLRFVVAVMKINTELERIGDLASHIAQKGKHITTVEPFVMPIDMHGLAVLVEKMLDESIVSLVEMDLELAKKIVLFDDTVDKMHRSSYEHVKKAILADPANYDSYINCLSISRHLERVGDLATNIAEDVYYMIEGKIIRHAELE